MSESSQKHPRHRAGRPRLHRTGKPIMALVRLWPGDPLYEALQADGLGSSAGSRAARIAVLARQALAAASHPPALGFAPASGLQLVPQPAAYVVAGVQAAAQALPPTSDADDIFDGLDLNGLTQISFDASKP